MTVALFLGRFQPFHLGHLDAIKQILSKCNHIIIAIGSAQYFNKEKNPFSYEERKEMIEKVLIEEKISNFEIIGIDDIHNYDLWVKHVDEKVPKYDVIFTASPLTKKLFSVNHIVQDLEKNINISGEMLRKNTSDLQKYLHPCVLRILKDMGGVERINIICNA